MVENYAIFDVRLRRLTSLMASDGPDETQFFEATWLLGELTMHCYTFKEERGDGDEVAMEVDDGEWAKEQGCVKAIGLRRTGWDRQSSWVGGS